MQKYFLVTITYYYYLTSFLLRMQQRVVIGVQIHFWGRAIDVFMPKGLLLLELEIKHKHGGFNINYEKATVVWQQFGFGS
jgi:hypothetical protein